MVDDDQSLVHPAIGHFGGTAITFGGVIATRAGDLFGDIAFFRHTIPD